MRTHEGNAHTPPPAPAPALARAAAAIALAVSAAASPAQSVEDLTAQPSATAAEQTIDRPTSSGRLVAHWDFEDFESDREPVPRNWFRSLHMPNGNPPSYRPGFPSYNLAELDNARSAAGSWSVKLPTRGGSTALRLARGVLPIQPDGDLMVTARVRTEGLAHARARISGNFLDRDGDTIEHAHASSEPVSTGGAWTSVRFELTGPPDAAYLQLELQLLQPSRLGPAPILEQRIVEEDVDGAAWFDELHVFQIPRITLRTADDSNIVVAPDRPELMLRVHDLAGEPLLATVRVYALDGSLIDEVQTDIAPLGRAMRWTPELPGFGWYRATTRVHSSDGVIGNALCDLAWLPTAEGRGTLDRARFGVIVGAHADEQLPDLPGMLRRIGTGAVWLDVWARGSDAAHAGGDGLSGFNDVVEDLLDDDQAVTFVLERVPEDLARRARIDPDNPLALLVSGHTDWIDALTPLLSRFGERVRRWQVGAGAGGDAFWRTDLPDAVAAIRRELYRLIPSPIVVLPWRIDHDARVAGVVPAQPPAPTEIPQDQADAGTATGTGGTGRHTAGGVDALTLRLPAYAPADAIADYARTWPGSAEVTLVIEPPDAETFGYEASIIELARRAVLAWAADVPRLAIDAPWTWRDERLGRSMPTPELPVWRTLVDQLAGRRIVGELPAGDGVRALLAVREDTHRPAAARDDGLIIAWTTWADPSDAALGARLADGPLTVTDLFGNASTVAGSGDPARIPLGPRPVFVAGVDAELALFRAGLRVEPGFIESRAERHELELLVHNPWNQSISGQLRIAEPARWDIRPRAFRFAVAAGATERLPFTVALGIAEEAGRRDLGVEVLVSADRRYPPMKLPVRCELGLSNIQLLPSYRYVRNDRGVVADAVVTLLIANTGAEPATLEVFAHAPGYPSQEAAVSALAPSDVAVRRFRFPDAMTTLVGSAIRVGVAEREGTGRLSITLPVQ